MMEDRYFKRLNLHEGTLRANVPCADCGAPLMDGARVYFTPKPERGAYIYCTGCAARRARQTTPGT